MLWRFFSIKLGALKHHETSSPKNDEIVVHQNWLVLTGTMDFYMTFHSVGNVIIPTDELIFFKRGRSTTRKGRKKLIIQSPIMNPNEVREDGAFPEKKHRTLWLTNVAMENGN